MGYIGYVSSKSLFVESYGCLLARKSVATPGEILKKVLSHLLSFTYTIFDRIFFNAFNAVNMN